MLRNHLRCATPAEALWCFALRCLEAYRFVTLSQIEDVSVVEDYVNAKLTKVLAPKLGAVEGMFTVNSHQQLVEVKLPQLRLVGGKFEIKQNDRLRVMETPVLTTVGGQLYMYNLQTKPDP